MTIMVIVNIVTIKSSSHLVCGPVAWRGDGHDVCDRSSSAVALFCPVEILWQFSRLSLMGDNRIGHCENIKEH